MSKQWYHRGLRLVVTCQCPSTVSSTSASSVQSYNHQHINTKDNDCFKCIWTLAWRAIYIASSYFWVLTRGAEQSTLKAPVLALSPSFSKPMATFCTVKLTLCHSISMLPWLFEDTTTHIYWEMYLARAFSYVKRPRRKDYGW